MLLVAKFHDIFGWLSTCLAAHACHGRHAEGLCPWGAPPAGGQPGSGEEQGSGPVPLPAQPTT